MRPPRADIAAPPLPAGIEWVGTYDRPRIERLTATGAVLVHFLDFAQLNSVRALPYVRLWRQRYRDLGLAVLGVHSPRYPFTAAPRAVAEAMPRLGVQHPVAVDSDLRIWRSYGCEGWPSLFLWGRGGALRWFHFGEGEYAGTEEVIQEQILELAPEARLPDPVRPIRVTDAPGALVMPPSQEVFPGGSAREPWRADAERPQLELRYEAGGAYASADGRGELEVGLDAAKARSIPVEAPGLHELAAHDRHERHRLRLRPSPGVRVWSISFAAGVPAGS